LNIFHKSKYTLIEQVKVLVMGDIMKNVKSMKRTMIVIIAIVVWFLISIGLLALRRGIFTKF